MIAPQETDTREKIRILIVDDHAMMRMGLMTAASDQPDMQVVADVENGEEALEAYGRHRPDVVVLDLRMHGMGGIETIRSLRARNPGVRVLIFSNYAVGEEIYQALKAGARGFVLKEMPIKQMLEAIRAIHRGEQYVPRRSRCASASASWCSFPRASWPCCASWQRASPTRPSPPN